MNAKLTLVMVAALMGLLLAPVTGSGAESGPPVPEPRPYVIADEATVARLEDACAKILSQWDSHPRAIQWRNDGAYQIGDWIFPRGEFEGFAKFAASKPYWTDADIATIADVHRQFKDAGIEMLIVLPAWRFQLYFDIVPELREVVKQHNGRAVLVPLAYQKFAKAVRDAGVPVIDCTPIFLANRGAPKPDFSDFDNPVYGGHGWHWGPYGTYVAASAVRQYIQDRPWYQQAPKVNVEYRWAMMTGDRMMGRFAKVASFHQAYGPQVKVDPAEYTDANTPVLVCGDSFVGGLCEQLSGVLRIPVARQGQNQLYTTGSISRAKGSLPGMQNKKLVIWEMDITSTTKGFRRVNLGLDWKGQAPEPRTTEPGPWLGPWWPDASSPTGAKPLPAASRPAGVGAAPTEATTQEGVQDP